jgi:predicted RNase H-like HicB family nuclease
MSKDRSRKFANPSLTPTTPLPLLTIYILRDEDKYMAKCPEIDLVTEMDTSEEALQAMLEMMQEYAEDYLNELDLYSNSPNRFHHRPYIEAISRCKTTWDLLELVSVRYGHVQLQSAA